MSLSVRVNRWIEVKKRAESGARAARYGQSGQNKCPTFNNLPNRYSTPPKPPGSCTYRAAPSTSWSAHADCRTSESAEHCALRGLTLADGSPTTLITNQGSPSLVKSKWCNRPYDLIVEGLSRQPGVPASP